jgi:transposase
MAPKYLLGIDVSKLTLDIALIYQDHPVRSFKIKNTEDEIKNFLSDLKKEYGFRYSEIVLCAEQMGVYNNYLINVILKKKDNLLSSISITNQKIIRHSKRQK